MTILLKRLNLGLSRWEERNCYLLEWLNIIKLITNPELFINQSNFNANTDMIHGGKLTWGKEQGN